MEPYEVDKSCGGIPLFASIGAERCSFLKTEDVQKVKKELNNPTEMELDHIFVWASPGGEEARALAEFGLS